MCVYNQYICILYFVSFLDQKPLALALSVGSCVQ